MPESLSRRMFVGLLGAGLLGAALSPGAARASVASAWRLPDLVGRSNRVLFGIPLESFCRWERVGTADRIVSYTRVGVEEPLAGDPDEEELLVRTLGGRVGEIGQHVHGEPTLLVGEPSLLFLRGADPGEQVITARAQGHYPLHQAPDGLVRLRSSPRLGELLHRQGSAVEALTGRTREQARGLVLGVGR